MSAFTPSAPPAEPAQIEITDAMVAAYLAANTAYWQEVDALPLNTRNPSVWRSGTPSDATRVSLRAALAAAPTALAEAVEPAPLRAVHPHAAEREDLEAAFVDAAMKAQEGAA